jgi:type III secretion system chaperone SycN
MDWCEEATARFCQTLGVAVPFPVGDLIRLEFRQTGALKLERHEHCLTMWLEVKVPMYRIQQVIHRAMSLTYSYFAPSLPMRCGWEGESGLLLFVTLNERHVTLALLQQAYRMLTATRSELLSV